MPGEQCRRFDAVRDGEKMVGRLTAIVLCVALPTVSLAIRPARAVAAVTALPLAHPPVTGSAGPYAHVTVTLRRTTDADSGPFAGALTIAGQSPIALAGPDEPADFFLFDVTAVMFTPIDRTRRNGVVILYDSSQIGPRNGTQQRALVYRVGSGSAQRVPALERRLEGAASAAIVRRRLRWVGR